MWGLRYRRDYLVSGDIVCFKLSELFLEFVFISFGGFRRAGVY